MLLTQRATTPTHASLSSIPDSNKHCVFRSGEFWFSVPAISVRQIVIAPELVRVPNCHRALIGLGRLRGEFVPIVALGTLLEMEQANDVSADACLLVLEGSCIWSLLISEPAALESLETIVSQEALGENTSNLVIGTAMYRDCIVRVLNPNGLLATAQRVLDQFWNRTERRNALNS